VNHSTVNPDGGESGDSFGKKFTFDDNKATDAQREDQFLCTLNFEGIKPIDPIEETPSPEKELNRLSLTHLQLK
jgi:hypothetical protein